MDNETNVVESTATPYEQLLSALENMDAPDVSAPAPAEATAPVEGAVETGATVPVGASETVTAEEAPSAEPAPTETPSPEYATKLDIQNVLDRIGQLNKAEETPTAPEPTIEDPAEDFTSQFSSEEFMEKFYDDPAGAVENAANIIAEKKIKEAVSKIEERMKPLLDQSEAIKLQQSVKEVIGDFLNDATDAKDYFPEIANYIKANKLDPNDKNSYVNAYRVSKLGRQEALINSLKANQGRTLNDYLNDESSLNEILNNEKVKSSVIDQYLKGLNEGGKPVTIGRNGTAQPVASPTYKGMSLGDAKKAFLESLG